MKVASAMTSCWTPGLLSLVYQNLSIIVLLLHVEERSTALVLNMTLMILCCKFTLLKKVSFVLRLMFSNQFDCVLKVFKFNNWMGGPCGYRTFKQSVT